MDQAELTSLEIDIKTVNFQDKSRDDSQQYYNYYQKSGPLTQSKSNLLPFYSAIATQLILQVFILINLIGRAMEPIRFSRIIGLILVILIGIGILMALITILLSIDYSKDDQVDFGDFQSKVCIMSVLTAIIVGAFVLFALVIP